MSGHSKWATIHRQKELNDSRRGQMFTKVANAITVAVRDGGGVTDPESNFKLRLAVEKARQINMPKENIQRAIDRGKGAGEGAGFEEILYEGFAPGGVGILIEAVTDSKQRTGQVIKNLFDRGGGTLAGPGAVAYQFQKKGLVLVEKKAPTDEQILSLIDLGAEDVEETEDALEVYVGLDKGEEVRKAIAAAGFVVKAFEQVQKPVVNVPVSDPVLAKKVVAILESFEELDDVQRVWANAEISDYAAEA